MKAALGALAAMAGSVMMAVILIVEDDFFIRELAEMTIQDLGYETLSVGDVDEALLLLRSPQHVRRAHRRYRSQNSGPWRIEACSPGYQASAAIACDLHDGQFPH